MGLFGLDWTQLALLGARPSQIILVDVYHSAEFTGCMWMVVAKLKFENKCSSLHMISLLMPSHQTKKAGGEM